VKNLSGKQERRKQTGSGESGKEESRRTSSTGPIIATQSSTRCLDADATVRLNNSKAGTQKQTIHFLLSLDVCESKSCRIRNACFSEAFRAQQTGVAFTTSGAVLSRIVAAVGE